MSNIQARTFPIALGLGGVAIIVMAISANGFGNLSDSTMWILVGIGFVIILLGLVSYFWERDKYYADRKIIHLGNP